MKIAIMGFGTVGSGVKEVLELNRAQIEKKGGEKIEIKYILSRHEHIQGISDELITTDFATIENDPEGEGKACGQFQQGGCRCLRVQTGANCEGTRSEFLF